MNGKIIDLLNRGALVVMAAAFLWLVHTIVNDYGHKLDLALAKLDRIIQLLEVLAR